MSDVKEQVAKRRAARQKKIRRKRLMASFIFLLIIAVIVLVIMCFTVFFPVKTVHAVGSNLYTQGEIVTASGITQETNLFVISRNSLEDTLRKNLPYIDSVTLKREFPDTVILTVKDADEYACYKKDELFYAVSEKGYVLASFEEMPENTFEISAGEIELEIGKKAVYNDERRQSLVIELIDHLQNNNINIDKIDVTDTIGLKATVEGKFNVVFGTNEYLDKKVTHLAGMIGSIGDRSGEINLSMWSPSKSEGSFVPDIK